VFNQSVNNYYAATFVLDKSSLKTLTDPVLETLRVAFQYTRWKKSAKSTRSRFADRLYGSQAYFTEAWCGFGKFYKSQHLLTLKKAAGWTSKFQRWIKGTNR